MIASPTLRVWSVGGQRVCDGLFGSGFAPADPLRRQPFWAQHVFELSDDILVNFTFDDVELRPYRFPDDLGCSEQPRRAEGVSAT